MRKYFYTTFSRKNDRNGNSRKFIYVFRFKNGRLVQLNNLPHKVDGSITQDACAIIHKAENWKRLRARDIPEYFQPKEQKDIQGKYTGYVGIVSGLSYNAVEWALSEERISLQEIAVPQVYIP